MNKYKEYVRRANKVRADRAFLDELLEFCLAQPVEDRLKMVGFVRALMSQTEFVLGMVSVLDSGGHPFFNNAISDKFGTWPSADEEAEAIRIQDELLK